MTAAATRTPDPQQPSRSRDGEWFWRFLAVVMLAVVGWVVWIAIQISPPEVILPAAYEAAAKARATDNNARATHNKARATQDAASVIGGPPAQRETGSTQTPAVPVAEVAPYVPPHSPPVDPPVNVEKLKFADSIETPILEQQRRAGKKAADAAQ